MYRERNHSDDSSHNNNTIVNNNNIIDDNTGNISNNSIYRGRNHFPNAHGNVNVPNSGRLSICEEGGHTNIEVYRGTLITMVYVVSILLVCYTPLLISSIYCAVNGLKDETFYIVHYFTVFFALLNSFMNSVLCLWRVQDIRKAVLNVLKSLFSSWMCYRVVSNRRRTDTVQTVIMR